MYEYDLSSDGDGDSDINSDTVYTELWLLLFDGLDAPVLFDKAFQHEFQGVQAIGDLLQVGLQSHVSDTKHFACVI